MSPFRRDDSWKGRSYPTKCVHRAIADLTEAVRLEPNNQQMAEALKQLKP
jgi:hypothetical protein